jgi:putative ABC transport system permease protein
MPWHVELSRPAVAALRGLPRTEQEIIARRIRDLEEAGLPPAAGSARPHEARAVPAGDGVLMCVEDAVGKRIVVVTWQPRVSGAGTLVAHAVRRMAGRWMAIPRGGAGVETLIQDLRFAGRSLRRVPGFTIVAMLTLALGIGAAGAVFSVAKGVLFRPLPYASPDRVVTVWSSWVDFPDKTWVSLGEYQAYVQDSHSFQDLALYFTGSVNFTDPDNPERVHAAGVTPNTFAVLGVNPVVGRLFNWEEAKAEAPVVVLGFDVWQRRFGGDPLVVGRSVEIDGTTETVIGVMPKGFMLPVDFADASPTQVYEPQYVDRDAPDPIRTNGGNHGWYSVGRLAPGVSVPQARADLVHLADRWVTEGARQASMRFVPRVYAAKDDIVGSARRTILVLLGAVLLVVLIACANVANLMLSRSEVRVREIAMRTALGAGRMRLLRQLLTESLLLSSVGAALGLAMAFVGVKALLAVDPTAVPRAEGVRVDAGVVALTVGLSLLTTLLVGVAPALRLSGGPLAPRITDGARGTGVAVRSRRTQGLLVSAQTAMAVVLLTGSGLMMRTFVHLLAVDPGFSPERVLTLRLTAPRATYPETADVVGFYSELLRRVRALPQVSAAGAARLLPLASEMGDSGVRVEGYVAGQNESTQADWQWITPGYLQVMHIPILEGRSFNEGDDADGAQVILINQAMARHYFGDRSPLGAHISVFDGRLVSGSHREWATVVGVVGNIHHNGITAQVKERFYRPQAQVASSLRSMTLTIQARTGDPSALIGPVRRVVASLDPRMPVSEVRTMDQVMASAVAQPRFTMLLLGVFSALALVLAAVGVYGVLAYAVSRRTQEVGIRMALGARDGQVVRMVVRQGMGMAVLGVVVGSGLALGLTRFMQGMLYGVTPQDPWTFASVPLVFSAVAALACWIPAARAARIHPSRALRYE